MSKNLTAWDIDRSGLANLLLSSAWKSEVFSGAIEDIRFRFRSACNGFCFLSSKLVAKMDRLRSASPAAGLGS